MIKNKIALISLFAALFVLSSVLSGCAKKSDSTAAAGADKALTPLKIADINSNPVFRVGVSKGIFAKHGIDAQIITFGTPAEGINSLFIKQVDVAFGADFPILNAVSKGAYSIIGATGTNTDENAAKWKLFVRDDIKKPEDLKGRKISSLRGTFMPYLWDEYLAQHGVSVKDTTVVGQGAFDEAYIALKNSEVDAVWVIGSALISKYEAIQGVHQLADMSQTPVRIGGALIAPDSLIKSNPDVAQNFIKAIDEASTYAKNNPEETADILYKEVKQPREATLKDLTADTWNVGFTKESYDSLSSQKKYMVENGIIKNDFDLDSKLNLDAITKVLPDRVTAGK